MTRLRPQLGVVRELVAAVGLQLLHHSALMPGSFGSVNRSPEDKVCDVRICWRMCNNAKAR
eukprot:1841674-Pleurochrysis_carterae.AAC.1